MRGTQLLCVCLFVLLLAYDGACYKPNDTVKLMVNTVGPYRNPSETYKYYKLPFCQPEDPSQQKGTLGQILVGDRLKSSLYDIKFKENIAKKTLCNLNLEPAQVKSFAEAVSKNFFFEIAYDGIPIWNFVGYVEKPTEAAMIEGQPNTPRMFVYTHYHFIFGCNRGDVVTANVQVSRDAAALLTPDSPSTTPVEFTYSAKWVESDVPYSKRRETYMLSSYLPKELEIHWLSIMNSFVVVIMLVGFVTMILLRMLKKDYSRFSKDVDSFDVEDDSQDYGWKFLHGDVFRSPHNMQLLSSCIGIGCQFLLVAVMTLLLALVHVYRPYTRGGMLVAATITFFLTSSVAAYISVRLYMYSGGKRWAWNVILTALLFNAPFFFVWCVLNTIAVYYDSTAALPAGTVFIFVGIAAIIGLPGYVLGGVVGHINGPLFASPLPIKPLPREVLPLPWYLRPVPQLMLAGVLPFFSIYVELYYVFASLWGHKPYTLYGILAVVFLILLVVTACVTVSLTYFQLAAENWRWWWRSFINGGALGLFVFAYSIFYYSYKTDMFGVLQGSFYLGYMLMGCYAFFLMLGALGWLCSLLFVHKIYRAIKIE